MTNWLVYAKTYYSSSDLTDATLYQPMKFGYNVALKAVRSWVVVFNDPPFTALNMKVYANDENAASPTPSKLLYTSSNTWTKANVHTSDHACKELYFQFDDICLRRNTWYHFVINGTGYTGSTSSFLAWKNSYPDPIYPEGVTLSKEKLGSYPLSIHPIFARFNKQ